MSIFSCRYERMFFSSISRLDRELKHRYVRRLSSVPCRRYISQYCNLSPVPSTEDIVQHSTQASIRKNANRHKTSSKKKHGQYDATGKQTLSKAAQSSMEDTLQTHPIKKRNATLIELTRNDVIRQLPICLNFVTFNKPPTPRLS